jgi:hypothetical protein
MCVPTVNPTIKNRLCPKHLHTTVCRYYHRIFSTKSELKHQEYAAMRAQGKRLYHLYTGYGVL